MENTLPVYIAIVNLEDDKTGMQLVSFVDEPAIEEGFLSFEDQKEMIKLAVEDDEKRMCYGPIMLANKKIYRRTQEGFEYMIVFTPENIELMLQKFMSNNNGNNVDENHSFKLIDGVTLCQVFIKNSERGINPTDFPDAEEGSLFGIYHVDDDQLWEDIKNGEVKGFSLAGLFDLEKVENQQFSKINKTNNTDKVMSKLEKIKSMLKTMLQEFGDVNTDRGTLIYDGDELEIGTAVRLLVNEEEVDAEDGEYITDDKKKIVIADGKVESIDDIEEPEIEDAPADEEPVVELSKMAQAFRVVKEAFDESYEERYQQISAAISEKSFDYFYIVEASDAYAVISVWDEETNVEKFYKFDLTWAEDGMVSVSEPVEVKKVFVPKDEEPAQEEEKPEEKPVEEEKPEEEEQMATNNEPAALSAQEEFAKLDDAPKTKVGAKMEAMAKRGYKFNK